MEDYGHMEEMLDDLESIEVGDFWGRGIYSAWFCDSRPCTSYPQAHWAWEWDKRLESLAEDLEETTLAYNVIL